MLLTSFAREDLLDVSKAVTLHDRLKARAETHLSIGHSLAPWLIESQAFPSLKPALGGLGLRGSRGRGGAARLGGLFGGLCPQTRVSHEADEVAAT